MGCEAKKDETPISPVTQTFTFTFDSQGGTEVPQQTIKSGEKAQKPTAPTRDGYVFENWYQEKEFKTLFDFTKETITTNTTIYAKWSINSFTLTFNSKGGTEINLQTIKSGEKAQKPTDPTRDNYLFKGWYKEERLMNLFDFAVETIKVNTTVYAKWQKISKLTFSITSAVSSLQLEMSSNLEIPNIGAVIRLATEVAPTKEEAQASAGYVNLRIDADSTRKFSISQHYTSNFANGLTLDDVLAPNTNYKLYLFFESNAISSEPLIEGATLTNDTIVLSFTTESLPPVGDVVWDNAWTNQQFVGGLSEWSYSENQKGIFVAYIKINTSFSSFTLTSRTVDDIGLKTLGSLSVGFVDPGMGFLFGFSKLGNGYPDSDKYYAVISADDTKKILGKIIQAEIYDGSSTTYKLKDPLTRYSNP